MVCHSCADADACLPENYITTTLGLNLAVAHHTNGSGLLVLNVYRRSNSSKSEDTMYTIPQYRVGPELTTTHIKDACEVST